MYGPALLRGSAIDASSRRLSEHTRAIAGVSGVLALAAGALLWNTNPFHLQVPNEPLGGDPEAAPYYPVGAVAFLRAQRFHGNLLTPFNQGSYVLWKMYPSVKVSLDSRFEAVYEPSLVHELTRVYQTGEGLVEVLEKYEPDAVLVPRHSCLGRAHIPLRKVYEDAAFAVYVRSDSELGVAGIGQPAELDEFP
jgi:hypothetical protein